jgi:nitrogenase-stabilizing/protective protein
MNPTTLAFNHITEAEDYFAFFSLPYDPQYLNVNRLHILKKFSRLIKEQGIEHPNLNNQEVFGQYRALLQEAYSLFQTSSPQEQKLFKVFQETPGNVVMLSDIEVE